MKSNTHTVCTGMCTYCRHSGTFWKKKKKKKPMLSQADVYLDESNCDKVTLQLQQIDGSNLFTSPGNFCSVFGRWGEVGGEGIRGRAGVAREGVADEDLASACERCVNESSSSAAPKAMCESIKPRGGWSGSHRSHQAKVQRRKSHFLRPKTGHETSSRFH